MPEILIVDDDMSFAQMLNKTLKKNGFRVQGIASSGPEAIAMAKDLRPGMVLMDIVLDERMDGIEAARQIRRKYGPNSLFVTAYSDDGVIKRAAEFEPLGYLLKPPNREQILASVKIACHMVAMKRKAEVKDPQVRLNSQSESLRVYLSEELSQLTPSELRIVSLIIQGLQNKAIASKLNISLHTVEWHRRNIREKLGLLDRKENLMLQLLSKI